jgi:hypothetical protein
MNKFRIDPANQHPAMVDLLVQILANQHAFITAVMVEFAEMTNRDGDELRKRIEKARADYIIDFREWLLDNYGKLDVDDLVE